MIGDERYEISNECGMCLPSEITGNDIANVVDILTCGEPGNKGNTMLDCLKRGDKPTIHQIHREY